MTFNPSNLSNLQNCWLLTWHFQDTLVIYIFQISEKNGDKIGLSRIEKCTLQKLLYTKLRKLHSERNARKITTWFLCLNLRFKVKKHRILFLTKSDTSWFVPFGDFCKLQWSGWKWDQTLMYHWHGKVQTSTTLCFDRMHLFQFS